MIAWLHQHRMALRRALLQLASQPLASFLSALVLGISLALPAAGYVMLENLSNLARGLSVTPEISLFVTDQATDEQLGEIRRRLGEAKERLQGWRFVPRDEAIVRFRQSELADLVEGLPQNPLPDAFVLTPHETDPTRYALLHAEIETWPGVAQVVSDASWIRRLHALINLARLSVAVLAVLLGATLVIVTFNTIRLQLLSRRQEIEVSQLLGATVSFVRRPFYWFGTLQGILGGLFALAAVEAIVLLLREPISELAQAYTLQLRLAPPSHIEVGFIVGFAALLGWLGSAIAVRRHTG